MPKVSVILPYYNAENTLGKAVQSILNQSLTDFELLLVDNCSEDTGPIIANQAARKDSRIILLKENKRGVAHAMNAGLAKSSANYVARMDADDIAHPERLTQQYRFMEENDHIGLVGSNVSYVGHQENTAGFKRFIAWVNSFHSTEEISLNRFVEIPVVNPTLFFRRELYLSHGACFDGDFPEDYEMQLRYLSAGVQMAQLDENLLEWHDYSTRLTRNDSRYSTDAFFRVKAKYFYRWSEENNPFHPEIWVWGAGRKTRQRSIWLEKEGMQIQGRIDLVKSKPDAIHYEAIPDPGKIFVVSMVANPGAGEQIRRYLSDRNYMEGRDFILMA